MIAIMGIAGMFVILFIQPIMQCKITIFNMQSGTNQIVCRGQQSKARAFTVYSTKVFEVGITIAKQVVENHQLKETFFCRYGCRKKMVDQLCHLQVAVVVLKIGAGIFFGQ